MAKDVNIHIKTPGAQQAKQQLDQVSDATKKVGGETAKCSGAFSRAVKSLASWAAGLVGITATISAVTRAIRIQIEAIKEHGHIAEEHQKKLLALQSMGTFFEEHPEARKEVAAYAEYGRRPFGDVAQAWYQLESKGAGLTKAQKTGIMTEALELGRMEPEADLTSIIDIFSLYAKETRQKDINQIQNVIRQTLSQAGAELSQMGQYLPRFLSAGIAGGLTGAETAGLWAFATTRSGSPEQATVGIRNIFAALQGKGTPESQQLLKSLGLTPGMNIFEQLQKLSGAQRAGKFGVSEAEIIAGKENFAILLSMLTEPKAMMETVQAITRVDRPGIDITRARLEQIMGQDEVAKLEEKSRQIAIRIENLKGSDVKAMRWNVYLKAYEEKLREKGVPEWLIKEQLWFESIKSGIALEPGDWSGFGSPILAPVDMKAVRREANPVIINDHSTNYYPRVGYDERGPRVERDIP